MNFMEPKTAAQIIIEATPIACENINTFSKEVFRTRGGRVGSGMGTLLEALWGYYVNQVLDNQSHLVEIAWLADHEYNDFACIQRDETWISASREGELLRVEAKSMNTGADESKGHFDELIVNLDDWDLLLVLVWAWEQADEFRIYPHIHDHFVGPAKAVASLRDHLHIARGGSFVDRQNCPDGCLPEECTHHGEPLNASGKRERLSGPKSTRVSPQVSYAANFGGLVRMIKTNSEKARTEFRRIRFEDDLAHQYVSFVHRNYPQEERNQYLTSEWKKVAAHYNLPITGKSKDDIVTLVKLRSDYRDILRTLLSDVD